MLNVCLVMMLGFTTQKHKVLTEINSDDQLVVDNVSWVPCPAGTNGGLCQRIFSLASAGKILPKVELYTCKIFVTG